MLIIMEILDAKFDGYRKDGKYDVSKFFDLALVSNWINK